MFFVFVQLRVRVRVSSPSPYHSPLSPVCLKGEYSGFTVDGTFSEYVKSYIRHVTPIPDGINSAEAASILCAGVTVYRAIKYSNAIIGDWIVLPGAGGGLGHLAIQYATAMGLRVCAVGKLRLMHT